MKYFKIFAIQNFAVHVADIIHGWTTVILWQQCIASHSNMHAHYCAVEIHFWH